ncbi:MAG: Obg family GTPase CgtA [Treponema sp.]|jgi:GTP-binding protein|nr:Obg family GTPase CgtA [Treponema sp.]
MEGFADEALIEVVSGHGGNGCVAFRRERFVPHGGPAGGDGGRGGNVIFRVQHNLRTLAHLHHQHFFAAENGHDGEGSGRYGKKGADVLIPVPPGTVLFDAETRELFRDFGVDSRDFVFLHGGNGGWGNIHFKSSVNQAPLKALPGKEGKKKKVKAELQLIADIGFVGFPNAGKSSLLDTLTNARPKIAAYPFTTKIPNLGVLSVGGSDLVLADIPGILEGASHGVGLGIQFLKHISRTRVLAFLIDLSDERYREAFVILCHELESFSPDLIKKQRIIIGTKLDIEGTVEHLDQLNNQFPTETVVGISVHANIGLETLKTTLGHLV